MAHDISTLPDYPAEIRAPIGTLAGVSSFQLNFSSRETHPPGDRPDVLVALNPAALKVRLKELTPGGVLIINEDSFQELELSKAGYDKDPREDGSLAMTTTSAPGIALKSEAIGLAVMVELPMVIVNVQRGGPSTGLPTKTEQADLLQAFFGRNGECPGAIVSASTPSDCFDTAIEAFRIALKYMIPVFYLSDGYLANGSEPWKIPAVDSLPDIEVKFHMETEGFQPYQRDPDTLARPWAIPGTPGLEHRLGGIEKEEGTGNVCYDPENHERMVHIRAEKLERIAADIPDLTVNGPAQGDVLVIDL
jgi:2-oxoglutarate ferredoxin oxidoreductase subunit alpha